MTVLKQRKSPRTPTRALFISAVEERLAAVVLAHLREVWPGVVVTAVVRAGELLTAEKVVEVEAEGTYGFTLTANLLQTIRSEYDVAWAAVSDLKSPAYRRVAMLLRLARAKEKYALGPNGEAVPYREWVRQAGLKLGPIGLLCAGIKRLRAPYRRRRAQQLLHSTRPPWGFRRVNIGVSDRCNHRCIMCSEHSPYCANGGRRMSAEEVLSERDFNIMDAEMYFNLIRDLKEMGGREIELCGLGEPLLHPRLFDFIRQAKGAGLWVRLVSNADLLNETKAKELVTLGLDELHVSLNAGKPETYAKVHGVAPTVFEHVLGNMGTIAEAKRKAGKNEPVMEVSLVVQAANYREPVEWVKRVVEVGADIVTFSALGASPPEAPVRLSAEQMEAAKRNVAAAVALAKSKGLEVRGTFGARAEGGADFSANVYRYMPCYIGHIFALITASGRIHPCCACERVVGELKEGGFAKAWRGEAYRRFREECLDLPNRLPSLENCSCQACPYGPWNVEFHTRLYG